MDFMDISKMRITVRQFDKRPVEQEKKSVAITCIVTRCSMIYFLTNGSPNIIMKHSPWQIHIDSVKISVYYCLLKNRMTKFQFLDNYLET